MELRNVKMMQQCNKMSLQHSNYVIPKPTCLNLSTL